MKLVAVSDTHTKYKDLKVPDGDVFVHAGDIDLYYLKHAIKFNQWLGTLPHKYKIVVGGNHDLWLETVSMEEKVEILSNCIYLENSVATIQGVKFWGSPITPQFCDWAFMRQRGADIKRYWDAIPEKTDVLITHGPPQRILDAVPRGIWYDYAGCNDLHKRIMEIKPKVHIFGHIHCEAGEKVEQGVRFYNVGVVNEEYNIAREPTQIII